MSLNCATDYFYHNLGPGYSGSSLLNQTLYISGNGGPAMDGCYCDGVYVYTISGGLGVVTNVETVASLGCGGAPPPDPTPTATNWPVSQCLKLYVNIGSQDRQNSETGYVYFDFTDCNGVPQTFSDNVNRTNYDTGFCYDPANGNPYVYILYDGGVPTDAVQSYYTNGGLCPS